MAKTNLYEQLANLSPEQRELLEKRLREKGFSVPGARIQPRQDGQSEAPLSYAQQRLWFVQQFEPENIAYNVGAALRLRGQLDLDRLQRALNAIVARHESLRTSFFKNAQGEACQRIHSPVPIELSVEDLSGETAPESASRSRIHEMAAEPFDLKSPPLRFQLFRLAEGDHVLALETHHIICDRWSVMVFVRELTRFYADSNPDLPPLSIHYPDWAIWQREHLQSEIASNQLTYWKDHLSGTLPLLDLPTRSGASSGNAGEHLPLTLDDDLSSRVKAFAKREQVSIFTLLLTAFKVLLHRYSSMTDLVVGTEVANRDRPETVGMIGLLVNTLVLRTHLEGRFTFREALNRVRDTVEGGLNHQDLPFEKLVESLNPERDINQLTPLFQVKFDL
ncbi:MAG: condensation domain-containing protein, partial [Verrucomicrobiota bacterium]